MTSKRTIIITIVIGVVASIAIFGAGLVVAAENVTHAPIARMLAERFNLDVDEVQGVLNEEHETRHEARHETMEARHEARLDQAVEDGEITEAQKTAIVKKMDGIHEAEGDLKDKDPEERHEAMEALHDDFKKWLEDNDIDPSLIGPIGGGCDEMGKGNGMHGPGSGMGPRGQTGFQTL